MILRPRTLFASCAGAGASAKVRGSFSEGTAGDEPRRIQPTASCAAVIAAVPPTPAAGRGRGPNVFVVAIVLHLLRIFFTGAFRKPRELTYYLGVTILLLALSRAYLGYSLADDLLSGMGLAIGYAVALSLPFVDANLVALVWGGPFPGDPSFWSRMHIGHVLLLPVLIGTLIALHLYLVASRHHTQFRGRGATERRIVGPPAFPAQAPRSLGLFFAVAAVLFLMGGLVQINPVWLWGPYEIAQATNGAQPDWYLGWLIGALRLVPGVEWTIGDYTLVPNPFWGGAAFPLVVFAVLYAWPFLERRLTGDRAFHNLLDRPRDALWRTALGMAFFTWVALVFLAGSADRVFVLFGVSYVGQIWAYRVIVWVLPVIVLLAARRICVELQQGEPVQRERAGRRRKPGRRGSRSSTWPERNARGCRELRRAPHARAGARGSRPRAAPHPRA